MIFQWDFGVMRISCLMKIDVEHIQTCVLYSNLKIVDFDVAQRHFFADGDKTRFVHMTGNKTYLSLLNDTQY